MKKFRRSSLAAFALTVALATCFSLFFTGCYGADKNNMEGMGGVNDYYGPAADGVNKDPSYMGTPVNPDSEDYGKFIENQFILTENEPTSTFSSDVDTASYAYFRKLVNSGYDLTELKKYAGKSFRTEEFINYFSYSGNAPKDNELFGVKAQISKCPWNPETELLLMTLKAKEALPSAGNNLVFLIDVSGSMSSADKLPLLKKAFEYLVSALGENDTVSIVTYAGGERVVLDGCMGSKAEMIISAVNSLGAGGSTNGEAGIKKAYEIAEKHFIEGGNNRIIMASDGDLNVGVSSSEELKALVESKRDNGVYISTLGFGTGNYKDSNMEAIADNGNGVYYYIDGETEAEKIFGEDIVSTLYTVAKDVKFQLTFDPEYVESYRLVGYENRLLNNEDFTDDKKDAGEVGAGHTVTVCYELRMTEKAYDWQYDAIRTFMTFAVAYKNPDENFSNYNEYSIYDTVYKNDPDDDFKFAAALIELSMLLRGSEYLGDIGIDDIYTAVNALDLSGDRYKTEFRELLKKLCF